MELFTTLAGWKFRGDLEGISKSIVVVAPHTSYWDAVIGKWFLLHLGVRHKFLSKKSLFRFPFGIFMRLFGSMPVGGVKGHNAINDVCQILREAEQRHVVICPEGGFAPTDRWNPDILKISGCLVLVNNWKTDKR